jgi:hypothetical protein
MELLSFDVWWEGQVAITKIYWLITIPASAIFIVQTALTFLHADSKPKAIKTSDIPNKEGATIAFQPINFRNCIGFFMILGWSGLACLDAGLSIESTILTSLACGLAMMLSMATIFYFIGKLMNDVRENLD